MPESKRHGCACSKCRECCRREPGWFMPNEIETAAMFLKMNVENFIRTYCEEHLEDGALALSPKRKKNSGACIFLNKKELCDIHKAKPYECRKVYGCEPVNRHKRIREIIKKQWLK